MIQKYFIPFLALLGAISGLCIVFWTQKHVPTLPIIFPPSRAPYAYTIAGAGLIEASSRNIAVGTPFDEIVAKVYVVEGDNVKAGDPLFQLDLRNLTAQAAVLQAAHNVALITLDDKKQQYSFYQRLKDTRAVSEQIYQQSYYAYQEAQENVKVAKANLEVIETSIERSTVRAPLDGQILQVNIHPGEIAPVSPFFSSQAAAQAVAQGSLILMGTVHPLVVRVDIDEDDAWRYKAGSAATAFVRGNSAIHFPLKFVKVEPYVIPKSSFTGQTAERVDTRVLQVLYSFDKGDLPVYAGQILDVYIEAEPIKLDFGQKIAASDSCAAIVNDGMSQKSLNTLKIDK